MNKHSFFILVVVLLAVIGGLFMSIMTSLDRPIRYLDYAADECVAVETKKEGLLPSSYCEKYGDAEVSYVAPGTTYEILLQIREANLKN